jgi:hypothetical protein
MIKNKSVRKIVLGLSAVFLLLCPLMFLSGMFLPRALGFMDGIMCPAGSYITNYKYEASVKSLHGTNTYSNADVTDLICLDEQGNQIDISWKLLIILFSLPIISGALWFSTQKVEVSK